MSSIEGWRELESDPGLFTLLIEDMGVKGVEVEEIYDLSEPIDRQIYGFIFLFKWTKDRRSRRMMQEQLQAEQFAYDTVIADKIFFAQQIIPNSCATHALLSILLNSSSIDIGETLSEFRQFTKDHNPEVKGLAIGNVSKLVKAHNNHARPENRHQFNTRGSVSHGQSAESFHFVSYVPIDGHLYELDGLKPYPIDHGILREGENWTETFRRVIKARLGIETQGEPCHEIRYNLMSIVVDKRITLLKMMFILVNCQNVVKAAIAKVKQLVKENQQKSRYRYGKKSEQANEDKKLVKILKEIYAKLDSCDTQEAEDVDGMISHNNNYKNETFQLDERMNIDKLNVFENSDSSREKYHQDDQNSTDDILENDKATKNFTILDTTESNGNQILNDCVKNNSTIKKRQKKAKNGTKDDFKATKRKANIGSNDIKLINGVVESIMNSTVVTIGLKDKLPNISEDAVFMDKNRKFIKESLNDLDAALSPREVIDVVADELLVRLEEINISYLDIIWDQAIRESRIKSYSKFNAIHHEHNYFKNSPDFFLPAEVKILKEINKNLESRLRKCDEELNEEIEKRKRYAIDNCRRIHNYDPFISTFLRMLADSDSLLELVERNCELSKRQIRYGKKSPFNNRKRIRSTNRSDCIKKKGKNLAT